MIFLEETVTRLSLAVIFNDAGDPGLKIPQEEVSLAITGNLQKPIFHRSGHWLFLDLPAGSVDLSWKSLTYEDGTQTVDLDALPALAPVVPIPLTKSPVT